jgi:hypothetical protein
MPVIARNVCSFREADTVFSQLSQSTEPEKEISIWLDEKEQQHSKRQQLNDSVSNLTDGCVSPLQSTLNTEWDDISSTQRKYYARKAGEIFAGTLSVLSPGQEEALWESIRRDPLLKGDGGTEGTIINEAESWQTKRQILSLFGMISAVQSCRV